MKQNSRIIMNIIWVIVGIILTNHAKNSPTSIGGEMNWHKKLLLDNRNKIEYT